MSVIGRVALMTCVVTFLPSYTAPRPRGALGRVSCPITRVDLRAGRRASEETFLSPLGIELVTSGIEGAALNHWGLKGPRDETTYHNGGCRKCDMRSPCNICNICTHLHTHESPDS
jgi:hypothetical protein